VRRVIGLSWLMTVTQNGSLLLVKFNSSSATSVISRPIRASGWGKVKWSSLQIMYARVLTKRTNRS
jgi:hypothetical protein